MLAFDPDEQRGNLAVEREAEPLVMPSEAGKAAFYRADRKGLLQQR